MNTYLRLLWAFVLATSVTGISITVGAYYSFQVAPHDDLVTPMILAKSLLVIGTMHFVCTGVLLPIFLYGKQVREREVLLFLLAPLVLYLLHGPLGRYYEPAIWLTTLVTTWRILTIRQQPQEPT